jgi:CHAT domain-containing protein
MGERFLLAIVRVFGRWELLLLLALAGPWQAFAGTPALAECKAQVRSEPRALKGYICLLAHMGEGQEEALRFLDARMRLDPPNPRPHLYAGVIRSLVGQRVDPREWRVAIDGFAREHDVAGEIYASTSLLSATCLGKGICDEQALELLRRTRELARSSGGADLQQVVEIWTMKLSFARDDMDSAEAAERRLLALGPPRSPWIQSESLQARAHLMALLGDYRRMRALYVELLGMLDADDPRRPVALGGLAAATVHLATQRLESHATAERLLREAITAQEKAGRPLVYVELGYLASRVQLAMLLGSTPESFALLRSALGEHLSRRSFSYPMYPRLVLSELLATAEPPRLGEAVKLAEEAVTGAFTGTDFEKVRGLVLRSRIRFRMGEFSLARADGLAALDRAERLREQQRAMPLRLRYAQSLSFAYQSLAGALARYRPAGDTGALDEAFQVMERLRARGLMETLLAGERTDEPVAVRPPTLGQVQARLGPTEALLSYQIWRPEPTMDAPYREGSSWVTVVTRSRVEAFPIPNADVLDPQIRAWTGLLERRDGSDRAAGARLHRELLAAPLASLPHGIERLVIVPDGALHRLPFDALSRGPGVPYLAEQFFVSISPSASLWVRLRAAPPLPPGKLLVLADPSSGSAAQAILRDATGAFGALVHARREAEVALAAFPSGSEMRAGAPASENFLKLASLEGVSLLHLATHAVVDELDPEHAAVVLAPGSASEDGRLEPQEIGRLQLAGRTVVLAGCKTSAGPVFRGEGVMSLARAFFGAGASAVVGTLDRARDDEAAVFFSAMYRALARGVSVGEAVTVAKREAIRRGAPPAAWSDVVLLGDAQARPRARELPEAFTLAVTGVVLSLMGFGASRRWRRNPGPRGEFRPD